jgi:hypothetical protein
MIKTSLGIEHIIQRDNSFSDWEIEFGLSIGRRDERSNPMDFEEFIEHLDFKHFERFKGMKFENETDCDEFWTNKIYDPLNSSSY